MIAGNHFLAPVGRH